MFGIHVHQNSADPNWTHGRVLELAQTGRLYGAKVINDIGFANDLAQLGVPYVVWGATMGTGDGHERPRGDASDIERGKNRWKDWANQNGHNQLDRRVYVRFYGHNEQNYEWPSHDGYWYLGAQQAANGDGRLITIFSDGVGHPMDWVWKDGKLTCNSWKARIDSGCMAWGAAHGNLAELHEYGRCDPDGKPTSDPGSAIWPDGRRDDNAYLVYGGRHTRVWQDIIPADSRMKIFVGECGPSDAVYRGPVELLSDMKGYIERYRDDPYIVAYCYWTLGRGGGDPGDFAFSAFDLALPDVLAWAAAR